ncbi:MAG TPA: matrixin family metalloprotease [Rubrobacter sp.]
MRAGEQEIDATELPEVVEPGRCPVEGRQIVDGAVRSAVPPPGKGVYAEVLTTSGAQELDVIRRADGTVELDHVGDDASVSRTRTVNGPGECEDPVYKDNSWRVTSELHYRFNVSTTPREIRHIQAVRAVRLAGVVNTRNACHLGDQVPAALAYDGFTSKVANIQDGSCLKSDGESVVSFGYLPKALALTCTYFKLNPSGYNEVGSSDVKVNSANFRWTTRPRARSCKHAWDLQSVLTHERGHTFGLGHVREQYHGRLTMSPVINGPCQKSERTLGKGDVLGLEGKYP